MTYRPMTTRLYKRLCEAVYRLDEKDRPKRFFRMRSNLRISKALFDDHGTFHPDPAARKDFVTS